MFSTKVIKMLYLVNLIWRYNLDESSIDGNITLKYTLYENVLKLQRRLNCLMAGSIFEDRYKRKSIFRVFGFWRHKLMACSRVYNYVLCNISVADRLRSVFCSMPQSLCFSLDNYLWRRGNGFPYFNQISLLLYHRTPQSQEYHLIYI
jgi:hypothetical protein